MPRRKLQSARAVLTGGSSGIGAALARELSRCGTRLIITARRKERLEQLTAELRQAGGEVYNVVGDVTESVDRARILQTAAERFGGLDLLLNNAGIGALGPFADADDQRLRKIMEVNFFAPASLIREAIPLLEQGHRPIIVNMGSVLGHRAVPNKSEYCASKFALHGLSDAIRAEWADKGIDVLLVSPSTTKTEFFQHVIDTDSEQVSRSFGAMTAEAVARKTVRAIRKGRHEIILSSGGKLLVWIDRLCPPLANRLIAKFG